MNINIKRILIIMILAIIILSCNCFVEADTFSTGMIDPNSYNPNNNGVAQDTGEFKTMVIVVIRYLNIIGIIISVLALAAIGIKYMVGSAEEKADYKKSMVPYLVGVTLLFGITTIITIVSSIAKIF